MKKIGLTLTSLLLLLPFVASAQSGPQINPGEIDPGEGVEISGIIEQIITWLLGVAALIAVLFLIIGGLRYIISSGNETQSEAAKKTILYSIIGLVVIILSYVIVRIVISGSLEFITGG